ncbi:hypothetical protein [Aeromonas sp. MdU4]|uniref:hypothetical protein n=1 Tax=Aeromonas sp. MdU4 TaxID=3342819 RepID=UPI0035BAD239
MRAWVLSLSLGLLSVGVQAKSVLQPECNLDKALKNEAMGASVGVKGRCDSDMLMRQQKEKAKDELKNGTADQRDKASDSVQGVRDDVKATQHKVDKAENQLKKAHKDVKAVANDPLKAAATAVINNG